jgi:hypothetical protein
MRYRGYLGEVTVAGDLLLLTTHAHGPQRQWQLALEDIGQVRLTMPEGERPGSLQVLPLAPAEFAGDEYAVQFEAGDADTFTALAAWLEDVVQLNVSDGDAPAEDVGVAAEEAADEDEDDGTLVFWGVSDLPAAPEPTTEAPPYAMRLLVAGSITAVLLVAVVVLTWPGGGKKAADHTTARRPPHPPLPATASPSPRRYRRRCRRCTRPGRRTRATPGLPVPAVLSPPSAHRRSRPAATSTSCWAPSAPSTTRTPPTPPVTRYSAFQNRACTPAASWSGAGSCPASSPTADLPLAQRRPSS